jgi:hypothetical protein
MVVPVVAIVNPDLGIVAWQARPGLGRDSWFVEEEIIL